MTIESPGCCRAAVKGIGHTMVDDYSAIDSKMLLTVNDRED
jgi:hypothetical protein